MSRWSHISAAPPASRSPERGVALVEAAFAIPIFLLMLLGFLDLGTAALQTSQATSGAADGARTAIVAHARADVVGSPNRIAIERSVRSHLVGQQVDEITVTCLTSDIVAVSCAAADPDTARIRVTVSWRYQPLSPFGKALASQTVKGSATMAIIRQPIDPPVEVK
jgi:Flp pilus assembly protein TadG